MAGAIDSAQGYRTLYRRYRPQRFAEIRGQDHVVLALRNAVRDGRVAHAYLFSGPRGTGKTSTARILAKALNCAKPVDGEPCGECDSCKDIARGASLDVHELDAASNNKVDDMRDLVSRAALASPGEWKVYIVDEVHMLTTGASNALLKTLEEPPGKVVFVLATTDPQKVLPTIRSRTQHYEFHLFEPHVLAKLLEDIAADAKLDVPADGIQAAVRRGHGSARDAVSALDQVVASGVVEDDDRFVRDLVRAIAERETELALKGVAAALVAGFDAPRLASDLVDALRAVFLAAVAPGSYETLSGNVPVDLPALGPARCVRALELLGTAIVDMRESLDARTTLEVALVRLTHPEVDDSTAALIDRLERLERKVTELSERPVSVPAPVPAAKSVQGVTLPPGERPALGAFRTSPAEAVASEEVPGGEAVPVHQKPVAEMEDTLVPAESKPPSRDDLVTAWADHVLGKLRPRARAIYSSARFVSVDGNRVTMALPNAAHVEHATSLKDEIAATLSTQFACKLSLELVADVEAPDPQPAPARRTRKSRSADEAEVSDEMEEVAPEEIAGLGERHDSVTWVENRLLEEFPGAEEVS